MTYTTSRYKDAYKAKLLKDGGRVTLPFEIEMASPTQAVAVDVGKGQKPEVEHIDTSPASRARGVIPVGEEDEVTAPQFKSHDIPYGLARGDHSLAGSDDRPGRIRLSKAQLEHAAIAGITPVQYAEQLIRLRDEKQNGRYGGEP